MAEQLYSSCTLLFLINNDNILSRFIKLKIRKGIQSGIPLRERTRIQNLEILVKWSIQKLFASFVHCEGRHMPDKSNGII